MVKSAQADGFSKEISHLMKRKVINKKSNFIALNLFLEKDGVLRVRWTPWPITDILRLKASYLVAETSQIDWTDYSTWTLEEFARWSTATYDHDSSNLLDHWGARLNQTIYSQVRYMQTTTSGNHTTYHGIVTVRSYHQWSSSVCENWSRFCRSCFVKDWSWTRKEKAWIALFCLFGCWSYPPRISQKSQYWSFHHNIEEIHRKTWET